MMHDKPCHRIFVQIFKIELIKTYIIINICIDYTKKLYGYMYIYELYAKKLTILAWEMRSK